MKKIFAVILILSMVIFICACDKDKNNSEELAYSSNVSYYQTHQYTGENADFAVSVSAGRREKVFVADGTVGEMADYATVSVIPLNLSSEADKLGFILKYEGGEITGELTKVSGQNNYEADVEIGENINTISSISLTYGENSTDIELQNRLENMLTWQDILAIATKELADIITQNTDENGIFTREICIKYIRNRNDVNSPYYWYVSMLGTGFNYAAVLIDPESGAILTKKL